MPKNLVFYVAVLALFGAGTYAVLTYGSHLQTAVASSAPVARLAAKSSGALPAHPADYAAPGIAQGLVDNLKQPLALLFLQVIVIVLAARGLGSLARRLGQPPVIGEMIAGILLGPSLLGALAPAAQGFLFPAGGLAPLKMLAQIGVTLFLFVVGIELDVKHLREKAHAAVLVSHASIVAPFFLGSAFALVVYRSLAPAGLHFTTFALFIGVSMSITAFPVLARILEDRRLTKTHLGSTAIACAAVDDVTAWCLLAVVVALAKASGLGGAALTIALTLAFVVFMLRFVRPRVAQAVARRPQIRTGTGLLAAIFSFVFASALATEVIGIHALFGAFLAGVCMPPDAELRRFLRERVETFSSVFLLPLFFAFTGLRTEVGRLADWRSWALCAGVIAVAITGKLGGSLIAARWTGMGWADSFALGALMNTRGLVELIVLNLGYDLGILPPRIFAMLVLMALVTTCMTGPLLAGVEWLRRGESAVAARSGAPA